MTSPRPRVEAPSASRAAIIGKPLIWASSTTAPPSGNSSHCPATGRPSGPVTVPALRRVDPGIAPAIASIVPSPPSAWGKSRSSSSGRTLRQPPAIASATPIAESEPLNESGAMTTRRMLMPAILVGIVHAARGMHQGDWRV